MERLFDFRGRATRNEFGLTLLWGFVAWIGPELIAMLVTGMSSGEMMDSGSWIGLLGIVLIVERLALVMIVVAAAVRRMHDHNSAWYGVLLFLIPFVGWILLGITLMTPSDEGENRYGLPRDAQNRNARLGQIFD